MRVVVVVVLHGNLASTLSILSLSAQGTNYRKTNAAMEMRRINRDSFWARAEVRIKREPHTDLSPDPPLLG